MPRINDKPTANDVHLDTLKKLLEEDKERLPKGNTYYVTEDQYARWKELGYI